MDTRMEIDLAHEHLIDDDTPGACPGGGAKGPGPSPLDIEKQKKKKSSEQILSYFTYILLLF